MFGRATIRLGIGPHSSCLSSVSVVIVFIDRHSVLRKVTVVEWLFVEGSSSAQRNIIKVAV